MVETKEKVSMAAVREAKEEAGLDVELVEDLGVLDKIERDEEGKVKYHFVIVDYLTKPASGEMRAMDDALEARWVHPRDFHRYEMSSTLIDLLKRINLYPKF